MIIIGRIYPEHQGLMYLEISVPWPFSRAYDGGGHIKNEKRMS